jgi:hypothetical protein
MDPPGTKRGKLLDLFVLTSSQQLLNGIIGRENLCPAVQNLTALLPYFFPASEVFKLIEQIFDRPSAVICQYHIFA